MNSRAAKTDAERWEGVREIVKGIDRSAGETGEAYTAELRRRIVEFERQHGMASEKMMVALSSGDLDETNDTAIWAWTWQTLKKLEGIPTTGTH